MELFHWPPRIQSMGEIKATVRIENAHDRYRFELGQIQKEEIRSQDIDAVVDTGAVMLLLPQELVEKLGLLVIDKDIVSLADDRKVEMQRAGYIQLTVCDRRMATDCLVGPPGCEPLVGQLVMEGLDLIPDPLKRTLTPRPESPFRATLKMKRQAGITVQIA